MEKMIIQEPCCIEQILPRTLKWDENTFWQTNGDVTFGLVMKAVSYLAGNEINVKVVTPVFSLRMARFMAWYWRREWLKGFSLLTKEAVGSDVWAELREMGDVVGDVVTHKNVKEGMIIIKGEKATVIVIGDLLSEVDAGLRNYITYVGNSSEKIKEMTSVAEAMMKAAIRKRKKEEEAFVARMNERAKELGCKNTHFENTTGLDDTATEHRMSARDIALISREVISHELVFNYSTIWMDTIRDGAFGLTNTNRLIRFYKGATGLKTGSTAKAKFCISATAERGGLSLIAVIMAAPTRDIRNEAAKSLFDFGFANYSVYTDEPAEFDDIYVTGGRENTAKGISEGFFALVSKGDGGKIEKVTDIPERLTAPIVKGEKIGTVTYMLDGKSIGTADILAAETVEKINFWSMLKKLGSWFLCSPPN